MRGVRYFKISFPNFVDKVTKVIFIIKYLNIKLSNYKINGVKNFLITLKTKTQKFSTKQNSYIYKYYLRY